MKNRNILTVAFMLLVLTTCFSQQTLDASDPSSFIIGGGQGFNAPILQLQPIYLVDVEPDPFQGGAAAVDLDNLEAGSAVVMGGSILNEDIWLNYTFRDYDFANPVIIVYSNQAVPAGMTIEVEVLVEGGGGNFQSTANKNPVKIDQFGAGTINNPLIRKIKNGYTGDGLGNGYQIRYIITNPNGLSLPAGFEIIYEIRNQ